MFRHVQMSGFGMNAIHLHRALRPLEEVGPQAVAPLPPSGSETVIGELPSNLAKEDEQRLGFELEAVRNALRLLLQRAAPTHDGSEILADNNDDFRESLVVAAIQRLRNQATSRAAARSRGRRHPSTDAEHAAERRAALLELADELDAQLGVYRQLRDLVIEANLRVVAAIARRYRHSDVPITDLMQEGTFGLMRAIEKWDPAREVRFVTYAAHWVRQTIALAADAQAELVRTPAHWIRERRAMRRAARELEASGTTPRREEVASAAGLAAERAEQIAVRPVWLSLDEPTGGDSSRTLGDILASPGNDVDAAVASAGLPTMLEQALARLPEEEAKVLRLRFGTNTATPLTLDEAADALGFSRERVRQLEHKALRRMAPICERQGLRGFVDS